MPSTVTNPIEQYRSRLSHRSAQALRSSRLELVLGYLRLAVFLLALVQLWLTVTGPRLHPAGLLAPALVFLALGAAHERTRLRRLDAEQRMAFYQRGIDRLENRWQTGGDQGADLRPPGPHLYSEDLDLFGPGSLFQLLSTCTTPMGRSTLADWLLAPADRVTIGKRHLAVAELAPAIDFREDLAAAGGTVAGRIHPDSLISWAARPGAAGLPLVRRLVLALVALNAVALTGWAAGWIVPLFPFLTTLALAATTISLRGRVARAIAAVDRAAAELAALGRAVARIEQEPFEGDILAGLAGDLSSPTSAARAIARLQRLVDLLESRRNQFLVPIRAVTLWGTQLGLAVEHWRTTYGSRVPLWLSQVGRMEALCSLASHRAEHPDDVFPEIISSGHPVFSGEALAHPLLPESQAVRNDVDFGDPIKLMVISGSNMSGKSTFLRAVGCNAALALAGATVRARRLSLSELSVGSSITVHDSLLEGHSRFYAEILRLKALIDQAAQEPLLFLIDEILHGTNSHDRRIGAEAVARALVGRGAVGALTTHDLAIGAIADTLGSSGANCHFEDSVVDGRMVFDYRMRPGVVNRSNALALMRQIGLEVTDGAD